MAKRDLSQYPRYSMQEIERCNLLLLMPHEKTVSLDVTRSGKAQFFDFVNTMISTLYDPGLAAMIRTDVFDGSSLSDMDVYGKFFVLNQLGNLSEIKKLGLIERRTPICANCLKCRHAYVPADPNNGKYCRECFVAKMRKSGCGAGDVVMPPG